MRALDEGALLCDFAQYYHIYDIDALEVGYAAILACGLPEGSRIIRKLSKTKIDPDRLFRATIIDSIRNVEWAIIQTHSKKKIKRPESLVKRLLDASEKPESAVKGYDTAEEFEAARARLLQEM